MRRLYIRWGAILIAVFLVATLGWMRYEREVTTIAPERLLSQTPGGTVRVLGRVKAGSLSAREGASGALTEATFVLAGQDEEVFVRYEGEPAENIRDLKQIVAIGRWDPAAGEFLAHETANLPNYGYVSAAYLLVLIPMGVFLFRMERRVELLYTEIKTAKPYEPEGSGSDQG